MRNSNPTSLSFLSTCFVGQQAPTFNTLGVSSGRWNRADAVGHVATDRAYSTSMHRHRPNVSRSPLMVEHKPMVDRLNVIVGRVVERFVRQVDRPIKEGVCNFFAHARILTQGHGCGYPYFPIVHFVHAATLSLDNANKNVRGA